MERAITKQDNPPAARSSSAVRLAATGDLHVRRVGHDHLVQAVQELSRGADLLLVAGDITENGRLVEAEVAAKILQCAGLPTVAVLGNHDLRSMRRLAFRRVLERHGIEVLEGDAATVRLPCGARVGIAGVTGSGGGFWPTSGPSGIPARTLKRLAIRARREGELLAGALADLDADIRVAAMHFAPTTSTLGREPLAKYWMLGNSELGEVVDRYRPDLVVHGHAHLGTLRGKTTGGVPVRNVAMPAIGGVHLEIMEHQEHLERHIDRSASCQAVSTWL